MAAMAAKASGVLISHHNVICNVLSVSETTLISLAGKLFSIHIVDRPTKTLVLSNGGYKGADILLDHVEMRVDNKPKILQIVLKAMQELEALKDIVEQMENWKEEDMTGEVIYIHNSLLKILIIIIFRFS